MLNRTSLVKCMSSAIVVAQEDQYLKSRTTKMMPSTSGTRGQKMNEREIEKEIQEKALSAPRLKPEDIDAVIVSADYHVFPGTTTTVCCLKLRNGYTVIGKSAAVSADNFDKEIGRKIAYADARGKVWELEGYRLKCMLYENEDDY